MVTGCDGSRRYVASDGGGGKHGVENKEMGEACKGRERGARGGEKWGGGGWGRAKNR